MSSEPERLILGVVPYWSAAVVICCLSSFLTVSGFVIQKKALVEPESVKRQWPNVGDIVLSPKWILGFTLAIIIPLPFGMIAYALAPMSLLSPLSGFTILLNTVLAPPLLGEPRQVGPDVTATLLILTGATLSTVTGDHGEHAVAVDFDRVRSLLEHPLFLGCIGGLAIILVTSFAITMVFRHRIEQDAIARPTNPPLHHVLLPAMLYAGFGGLTNLGLKALAEFLAAGIPVLIVMLIAVTVVLPSAVMQLNFMNRGLRLYVQVVFLPAASALLIVSNTFFGAVFYQEYQSFSHLKAVCFSFGVLCVVAGICVFGLRRQAPTVVMPFHLSVEGPVAEVATGSDCPNTFATTA